MTDSAGTGGPYGRDQSGRHRNGRPSRCAPPTDLDPEGPLMSKTVLVTGASTGIGRATALLLAREGFTVYAGVRKEADGQALGPTVTP
ncbi:SDR family NAD(P)-dependent oxidoreductase, partial [Nonomuraea sp. 10N515B]|uniref:SDR family NAD(P)-dependent oxidoreductase n=1 Tax=Nonomuraea sp. 10N515B TaxID=3457422 RepID=UPI003FCDEEA9